MCGEDGKGDNILLMVVYICHITFVPTGIKRPFCIMESLVNNRTTGLCH